MIIKQLSIFLSNKVGRFADVIRILAEAGVNLQAFTVSESSDFGILRLIVDKTDEAVEVLRKASYAVSLTDVLLVETPDTPGSLSPSIDKLTDAGIQIEYMYAFSSNNRAKVVIRTNDVEKCEALLS